MASPPRPAASDGGYSERHGRGRPGPKALRAFGEMAPGRPQTAALTDSDIEAARAKIVEKVQKAAGGTLRG